MSYKSSELVKSNVILKSVVVLFHVNFSPHINLQYLSLLFSPFFLSFFCHRVTLALLLTNCDVKAGKPHDDHIMLTLLHTTTHTSFALFCGTEPQSPHHQTLKLALLYTITLFCYCSSYVELCLLD